MKITLIKLIKFIQRIEKIKPEITMTELRNEISKEIKMALYNAKKNEDDDELKYAIYMDLTLKETTNIKHLEDFLLEQKKFVILMVLDIAKGGGKINETFKGTTNYN